MRIAILFATSLCLVACATGSTGAPAATAPAAPPRASAATPVAPAGPVLARVGAESISAEDFRAEMERRGGKIPGRFATPEQRQALLDDMIRARAVLIAARAAGFDRDPEFVATVERMLSARFLDQQLDQQLEAVEVTDADVAAFYQEHASEFLVPARVRGAWIFLEVPKKATPEKVEEGRQRAESVRAEALALPAETRNFGPVALSRSDDTGTRYIGGELGWLSGPEAENFRYGPEVAQALLSLAAPGDVSPVLRIEQGFALVKLVEREEAAPAPLAKMAPGIRSRLIRERREALRATFYADLLKDVPVSVDAEALGRIEPLSPPAPTQPAVPPPLPGGR